MTLVQMNKKLEDALYERLNGRFDDIEGQYDAIEAIAEETAATLADRAKTSELSSNTPTLGAGLIGTVGGGDLYDRLYGDRHLFQYLTTAQKTAVKRDSYAGWTQDQLTELRNAVQNAFNDSVGRRLIMPSSGYLKLNGPLKVPSRAYIFCPLGTHGAYKPLIDPADENAIKGGFVVYPDLSFNWKFVFPLRALIETDNYTWVSGSGSAKPDYWSYSVIEGITLRANEDAANYAANPSYVPDYGFMLWAPSDESKLVRCVARYFGRNGCYLGGTQATGLLQECSFWYNGANQNTVFGDIVTRPANAFATQVSVFSPVHTGSSFNVTQICLEAVASATLDSLQIGDELSIVTGSSTTVLTVSALATATTPITQRTVVSDVASTTRYIRTITVSSPITTRLLGRVMFTGVWNGNHPDRTFAPGIISGDGGQASGGGCRFLFIGGDFNRDALLGYDGAHFSGIFDIKAENHPAAVIVTGNAVGGGRSRISLLGRRVEHGTTETTEDYGMIRITGTCRPSVVWDNVAALNHINVLEDYTPLALGNGGSAGNEGKQYGWLPKGKNTVSLLENGGALGRWGVDGSDYSLFTKLIASDIRVDGNGELTIANKNNNTSLNYSMKIQVRFNSSKTYRFLLRSDNSELEWCTIDNINASGSNGTQFYVWNDTANGMQPSMKLAKDAVSYNMTALPMAFNGATPILKPAVTGAKGSNVALGNLITALVNLGLITDTTTT